MKYSAIIAVAAAQDITSLIQLNDCNRAGSVSGVSCEPARELLFATGMNGDEDLGEDITMKGNKFHFNQEPSLVQWDAKGLPAIPYPDEKMSEPKVKKEGWDNGYDEPEQVLQMDAKIAKKATTFY